MNRWTFISIGVWLWAVVPGLIGIAAAAPNIDPVAKVIIITGALFGLFEAVALYFHTIRAARVKND